MVWFGAAMHALTAAPDHAFRGSHLSGLSAAVVVGIVIILPPAGGVLD